MSRVSWVCARAALSLTHTQARRHIRTYAHTHMQVRLCVLLDGVGSTLTFVWLYLISTQHSFGAPASSHAP